MMRAYRLAALTVVLGALCVSPLRAGQEASASPAPLKSGAAPPPAPVPPATISRSAEGGVTVRAVRISDPVRLDGRLDEAVYSTVPPLNDFIEQEPREGVLAGEQTEAWILFDNTNIYVSARCWDSQPEREIANEMRRDIGQNQSEAVSVIFDTFHDGRNGYLFIANLLGGMRDVEITDEGNTNGDWNTIWDVRTAKFEQGWTVEIVIPFKSLRYNPGPNQVWGVNLRRMVTWKNEWSYLTPMPRFLSARAITLVSLAATMVGLEVPATGMNLEIKPYAISGLRTDRRARPSPFSNKGDSDAGLDVKYGLSKSLTLDLTYNTDFAQVEDDIQQVNLTRFNLQFPERREFFLENQGIFVFGGVGVLAGGSDAPILFFSRRIGLENGRPVPIVGGGRITGRAGAYSIGALNIQSDEDDSGARATNFSVLRVKRDIFRRSNIGLLYTRRQETKDAAIGVGETFGADALISVSPSLNFNAYVARTRTPGVRRDDTSHLASVDYNLDRYGVQLEHLSVGNGFKPAVGFVRRTDGFQREFALLRFSPRPAPTHMKAVRRFIYQGSLEYFENGASELETRETEGLFAIEFLSADRLSVNYRRVYELIPDSPAFEIATGVTVPTGGYEYQFGQVTYTLAARRTPSGSVSYQYGSLYGGTKRTVGFSAGRVEFPPHLAFEPSVSANWVTLPWRDFTSTVVTTRTIYTMTPRMFLSALIQYNSSTLTMSTNARLRWEYQPGSELFVVYSDGRDTAPKGYPELVNRAFIVKINRMFRF